jgi:hypothetical protein
MDLNIYMVYDRQAGPSDAACLVFHHTARGARYLAWSEKMSEWGCKFIDAAATRLKSHEHLRELYYAQGLPLLITDPPTCPACKMWGGKIDVKRKCCSECNIDGKIILTRIGG